MKYLLIFFSLIISTANASPPSLQLANKYDPEINLQNYWVSEKYDGVRAYWNGTNLISRKGNIINAPDWFTTSLTSMPLDGELWIARGKFDQVSGIIRQQKPIDSNWKKIKYMVFDLPASREIFNKRIYDLNKVIRKINSSHIQLVKQIKVPSHQLLRQKLDKLVANNGEGLMLHSGLSFYKSTRNNDLLKLKKYFDAEAVVIKHFKGKGKFKGMLGSMLVETEDKKYFKIGGGFSDSERRNPPAIGSVITYKYFGLTSKGLPRFASFLRVREGD